MAAVVVPRELSLHRLEWPEWVEYVEGFRVYPIDPDDPVWDPVRKGDGLLGWEGDTRMCFALNPAMRTVDLIRFEGQGHYSRLCGWQMGAYSWVDMVGIAVVWLLQHDRNRGFDPVRETIEHNRRVTEAAEKAYRERLTGEVLPQLASAMQRDGADIGIVAPVAVPDQPWKPAVGDEAGEGS